MNSKIDVPTSWSKYMDHTEIATYVDYCAQQINKQFKDTPIVLVCILKGAAWFFVDLTRKLTIPYSTYFVEASSYGNEQTQSEEVEILSKIIPSKFIGKSVILIDELYDNGTTMELLKNKISKDANIDYSNMYTCAIFKKNKPVTHKYLGKLDIFGVYVPDVWLVGYGLDDNQEKRGWMDLYIVPKVDGVSKSKDDISIFL